MNEKIKAYAKCEFHIENPKIRFIGAEMNDEIIVGQSLEKEFIIQSENDVPITGNVEAFDHRIELLSGMFETTSYTVSYRVSTEGMEPGQEINGAFHVLTNGGEYDVPYHFKVVASKIVCKGTEIHNVREFAEFASNHYEEALRIFSGNQFVPVLCAGELLDSYSRIYKSLRKASSIGQGMEEFLVTVKEKVPVEISPVYSNVSISYDKEDVSAEILVKKNTWGFVSMDISCESDAIFLGKNSLSREDFIGDQASIPIVVAIDKLPEQNCDLRVVFSNTFGEFPVILKIKGKHKRKKETSGDVMFSPSQLKKTYQKQLLVDYLDYRIGKITLQEYTNRSIDSANELMKFEDHNHWYRLIRLHMYIMRKDMNRVAQEFETIEQYQDKMITDDYSACYYLYLSALNSKDEDAIEIAVREIWEIYQENPDQFLLFFMILYLDDRYEEDRNELHEELKNIFYAGNNSPMLYYEACELYNEYPKTLRKLGAFELQALRWGFKKRCLNNDVKLRFVELAESSHTYSEKTFLILDGMYNEQPEEKLLQVICTVLMKGHRMDHKYHQYYALGVERSFKLIGLMEYYIKSMDYSGYGVLPQQVVMYFNLEDNRLNDEQLAYLYANVVTNRDFYGSSYEEYVEKIQAFIVTQVEKGNMSNDLVVLYKEFLKDTSVLASVAKQLPNILFKYRFTCDNKNITTVLVDYDEYNTTEQVNVVNGVAYIDLITDRANITLVDVNHRRYIGSIPYDLQQIIEDEKFLPMCFEADPNTFSVLLRLAYFARKANLVDYEIIKVYKALLEFEIISPLYRKFLNGSILHYYYEQYEGDIFEEYLTQCDLSLYEKENQVLAIQYMIDRELYDLAMDAVRNYGYYGLPLEHMKDLCNAMVEAENLEYDDLLVTMAYELFYAEFYTEPVLRYLIQYAKGGNRELISIYKAAKRLQFDTGDLEERIVEQAIISDEYDADTMHAFESYLRKKPNRFTMEAYFNIMAYRFFVEQKPVPKTMFTCWLIGYRSGNLMYPLTRAALLYGLSTDLEYARNHVDELTDLIQSFIEKDMLFPFMKRFDGIVELPKELYIKSYLIYRSESGHHVDAHYYLRGPKRPETHSERMREYFAGYYVKDFVLFDDDELVYYVTDEFEGETKRVEEKDLPLETYLKGSKDSRYAMINQLLKKRQDGINETLMEMLSLYVKDVYLVETTMTLL